MFLVTCGGPILNPEANNEFPALTNVEYSLEHGLMTLYLDGNAPVSSQQSRAINQQLAQMGHNFFEVIFLYNAGDDEKLITRVSWSLGEAARTSDLYRTSGGVDYSSISPNPPIGSGSALLFVGTSADKTLLAVGRLEYVDNGDGNNTPGGTIYTTTKSVTFVVNSLEAGLIDSTDPNQVPETYPDDPIDPSQSSFLTAAYGIPNHETVSADNTWVELKTVGPLEIPYYRLEGSSTEGLGPSFSAEYWFGGIDDYVVSSSSASTVSPILLAGPGTVEKKQPRFTLNDGTVITPPGDLDTHTIVEMENNLTTAVDLAAEPEGFYNPVKIDITPTSYTKDGMVFALVFSVPVYALSSSSGSDGADPVKWYIRPGFGTLMYDLDTGRGDGGGAIFMGTDDLTYISEDMSIRVALPPTKFQYDVNDPDGLTFDIDQLRVFLVEDDIDYLELDTGTLRYYIGDNEVLPGEEIMSNLFGLMPVTVVYTDTATGNQYTAMYYIIVGNEDTLKISVRYVDFYYDFYYVYSQIPGSPDNYDDAYGDNTFVPSEAIRVLILRNSLDIPNLDVNGVERTVIIVAGVPNITIGRGGDPTATWGGLNAFVLSRTYSMYTYLGTWPFNSEIIDSFVADGSQTDLYGNGGNFGFGYGQTPEFRINAGGSYERPTERPAATYLPQFMFRARFHEYSGAIVRVGDGVRINNIDMLYNH